MPLAYASSSRGEVLDSPSKVSLGKMGQSLHHFQRVDASGQAAAHQVTVVLHQRRGHRAGQREGQKRGKGRGRRGRGKGRRKDRGRGRGRDRGRSKGRGRGGATGEAEGGATGEAEGWAEGGVRLVVRGDAGWLTSAWLNCACSRRPRARVRELSSGQLAAVKAHPQHLCTAHGRHTHTVPKEGIQLAQEGPEHVCHCPPPCHWQPGEHHLC